MGQNIILSKVALVTGAARRIGASVAEILHREGMNVVLHYNASEEEAQVLCEKLNAVRPNSAATLQADLLEPDIDKSLIEKAHQVWGRLDLLVNNASRYYRTYFGKVTEYAWDDLMISNLRAPFFLAQAAAPYLIETKGRIINISDIHAWRPMRNYSVYCISKAGIMMLTRVLAKELAPHVLVNAIAPGAIIWPEGDNALSPEEMEAVVNKTPLARSGNVDDIARAALFLARDADFMTGEVMAIDGGRHL
ncbi:MAG TPA: pteridine reductase [Gammaproteobacteria bacterium]|nr:pteridine reductase [Gammaproteobacteria bacterium]